MSGLVSIIMPSYNTAQYISDSIQSVINQTYQNWELLIVDDCSTDSTDEIIKLFLVDSRIRYYKSEKNVGAAESRNRALREAKGRWIAFLDSDDLWSPTKLYEQIHFMRENNYGFSYTNYSEINSNGEKTGTYISGPKCVTARQMYRYCWMGCLTVMYDAEKIGLIQIPNIKKNNDYAMWLFVIKKEPCYLLNRNLAFYRRGRSGSISNQNAFKLIVWHYKLFRIIEGLKVYEAIFFTIQNIVFGIWKKAKYIKTI